MLENTIKRENNYHHNYQPQHKYKTTYHQFQQKYHPPIYTSCFTYTTYTLDSVNNLSREWLF